MRFISAQYEVYLGQGLWRKNAAAANAAAANLASRIRGLPSLKIVNKVETNALFASLPEAAAEKLRERYFFSTTGKGALSAG